MAAQDENTKPDHDVDDSDDDDDEAARLLAAAQGQNDNNDDDDNDDDKPLTPAGERALQRIKEGRREALARSKAAEKELADARKKIAEYEGKDKSVQERLQKELEDAKAELGKERSSRQKREAAEEYAPDDADNKLIRAAAKWINGSTDEELKASAEEFYSLFSTVSGSSAGPKRDLPPGKPKAKLRGGGQSSDDDDDEDDPRKLAARIPRPL